MKRQTGAGINEQLETTGGSSGGGAVTVADGADVAEGSVNDSAWTSGAGTVISLLKKIASAGGGAVSIADGADVAEGAKADSAATDSTSSWSVIALLKGLYAKLAGTLTVTGPLTDTQLRATAVPVSAATLPLPTNAATETGGHLATIDTKTPTLGQALAASSVPIVLTAIQQAALTPPAAITNYANETDGNLAAIKTDADAISAVSGTTAGAAVITDANGTIQQYLRGLVKLAITAGGFLVTATLSAGSAIIGKVGIDQTTPGTTNGVVVNSGTLTANAGTQLPNKTYYPAGTATITVAPQNVASSATFVAGVESDLISNITNLDLDHLISGQWRAGTNPTANTQVQIWVVPCMADNLSGTVTWPDVFDGTGSAETVTSAGVLYGLGRLGAVLTVDATTSARDYFCGKFSVAALFGGSMPTQYVIFITHNTGVNSDTTAGNFIWQYQRIQNKAA